MIIAANFKTNHTRSSTFSYCKALDCFLRDKKSEVYVFPPMSALPYDDFSHFLIGTQNAYPICNGALTGEIGLEQLRELRIQSVMIGHSERRTIMGESNECCKAKFDFFSKEGMNVFFCIGEHLDVRQNGGIEGIKNCLAQQLKGIDLSYSKLVIAYEPIWAIGTGVSASLEEIEETHQILKELGCAKVIYGGSVNVKNAGEIMSLKGVDGVLVGGASLEIQNFCEIITKGENV